ncbi:bifunctional diguanylate cyclase/phosphodiesterase [Vibrio ulleungensis]|uniref:EAL domain-containing protein n=1 Tax=Vibrio ulleungensis TaxID=2807619 RepID=A0ABS2HF40_9VIBR|nr:EAL domain-containing protein [Vibrio ulleungensis]MBM7034942.1 EAL domain-containing protein [Vibrio ulleungensis]
MTLSRQLVIGMILVFTLLLSAVFTIEFRSTQNYLIEQQRSEVHNTINTVGLALAPYLQDKDHVAAESVINALFDGSSYSVVRLVFLDDGHEIVRSYPITASHTPKWFVDLGLFYPQHDKRIVTSGWMQLAEVEIISHPGQAYAQLWKTVNNLGLLFISTLLFGVFAISVLVRKALTPLNAISTKMRQVANKQFGEPLPLPNTKELIPVVAGINSMAKQVEASFIQQANEAEALRQQAYMDPVSKLGNRSFYMGQVTQWLEESATGGLALIKAPFIKTAYDELNYEQADKLVSSMGEHFEATRPTQDTVIARLSVDEFAFIIPNVGEQELKDIFDNLYSYATNLRPDPLGTAEKDLFAGVLFNDAPSDKGAILSQLDNALSLALSQPEISFGFVGSKQQHTSLGKQQWLTAVQEAITNDSVAFRFQAAKDAQGNIYHQEVLSAIEINGERAGANQFLFALDQLKSGALFDEYVIASMIEKLESKEITTPIAINLTPSSIEQPSFIRWLNDTLAKHSSICSMLHFEIPESSFIDNQHHTALLCQAIEHQGALFGIDHYGRRFHSLEYIKQANPNYVKLDYLYTHQLEDEQQKFTLTSVARTAQNLGIKTIASRVETQDQLDFLLEHYVDVFQGFIVNQ